MLIPIVLFSIFECTPSFARIIEIWSYEKLVAESDLVAIVEPLENQPAKDPPTADTFPWLPNHPEYHFEAINTCFRVYAVLKFKGDTPKTNEVTVLHFGYATNSPTVSYNGPMFLRFLARPVRNEVKDFRDGKQPKWVEELERRKGQVWMAFLKRREDGRFEPLCGLYDTALSFREVHEPRDSL